MEEEQHTGLGVSGGGWAGFQSMVYDPKLAAGRGVAYSAAAQAGDVSVCCCCCSSSISVASGWLISIRVHPFKCRKRWVPWMTLCPCTTIQRGRRLLLPAPARLWTSATRASSFCSEWAGRARGWAEMSTVSNLALTGAAHGDPVGHCKVRGQLLVPPFHAMTPSHSVVAGWCLCTPPAGMVEPVAAGVDAGVRLGLGKQAQDDHYTAAENITRKKLEVEVQADETSERKERREVRAPPWDSWLLLSAC